MKYILSLAVVFMSSSAFAGKTADYTCNELKAIVADAGADGVEFIEYKFGFKSTKVVFSTYALAAAECRKTHWAAYCEGQSSYSQSADKKLCFVGWIPFYRAAAERP